jgi:signal transduction histidine kinase
MDVTQWERVAQRREYEEGDYIFREGDPGTEVMLIQSGGVMITKQVKGEEAIVLGYRTEGDTIGEIALLQEGPRTASVVATLPTVVLAIDRSEFQTLMRQDPDFQRALLETLIELLMQADRSRIGYATSEMKLWDRIDSLTDEQKRLAELIRLRQETINFIVHDLRNPINLAVMSLSMVEEEEHSAETAQLLTMATSALHKMQRMVESMLDVERLEGGDTPLEKSDVDVTHLVRDTYARFRAMAESQSVTFHLQTPQGPLTAHLDAARLERVLANLLDNAFKFTPQGGTVTLRLTPEPGQLRFAVIDTGQGIPEGERERIFARFAQTDGGRGKGFGLGLAFCRSAVQAHGGQIWVEEGEDGRGTAFIFTLPTG